MVRGWVTEESCVPDYVGVGVARGHDEHTHPDQHMAVVHGDQREVSKVGSHHTPRNEGGGKHQAYPFLEVE